MKTLRLLVCIMLMLLCAPLQLPAQCSLLNPAIELNSVSDNGTSCTVNINLSFTIDKNNGNKFTYVHLWKPNTYPNLSYAKKAPDALDLGAVLATLAIDTDGAVSLLSNYSPDPGNVTPLFTGLNINETSLGNNQYRITINNIQFPVSGACSNLPILKGDVWSTQAASSNPNIHCSNKDFNLQISDPVISGTINCNEPTGPRTYNLDITSNSTSAFNVTYKLYLDNGILISGQPAFGPGDQLLSTTTTSLSASTPVQSYDQNYTYSGPESQRSLWVELTSPSLPNAIIAELKNECDNVMPVKLTQFSAILLDNSVSLSWATTEESGSSHFNLERSLDSREFTQLERINAQDNTSALHRYNFIDMNPANGVNYYRLRMVDLDGSFEYSKIVSVDNGSNKLVFELLGNPTTKQEIRFLLKNGDISQIRLSDISGKNIAYSLVKSGNYITLTSKPYLISGIYILSLQNQKNGRISRKIIIP